MNPPSFINGKHHIPSNQIQSCFQGNGQEQLCHCLWAATGAAAVLALLPASMAAVCEESASCSKRTHGVEGAYDPWQKVEKKLGKHGKKKT